LLNHSEMFAQNETGLKAIEPLIIVLVGTAWVLQLEGLYDNEDQVWDQWISANLLSWLLAEMLR